MRFAQLAIIVASVFFIAWMGNMLYHVFETRQEFADLLQSTSDEHDHHVADIMQVKYLHYIHVVTALASFALFAGVSVVTVVEMRVRRRGKSRWHWISLSFTVAVAVLSPWSVGGIYWNTFPLELVLASQALAAAVVASVCGARLVLRSEKETETEK